MPFADEDVAHANRREVLELLLAVEEQATLCHEGAKQLAYRRWAGLLGAARLDLRKGAPMGHCERERRRHRDRLETSSGCRRGIAVDRIAVLDGISEYRHRASLDHDPVATGWCPDDAAVDWHLPLPLVVVQRRYRL